MRARSLAIALAGVLLAGCPSEETDIVTGGFDEIIVDRTVRHGQGFRLVDINGDGALDVVAALSLTDAVHLYLRGEDVTQPWEIVSLSGPGRVVAMDTAIADLDGDGDLDVAAVGLFQRSVGLESPGDVFWYENPGDVRGIWLTHRVSVPILVAEEGRYASGVYGARAIRAADFDGDGDQDLAVGAIEAVAARFDRLPPDGTCGQVPALGNGIFWFPNRGDGGFEGPFAVDPDLVAVSRLEVADVDADGRDDVVATSATGSAVIWYQNLAADAGPRWVRRQLAGGVGQYFGLRVANMDDDDALEIVTASVRNNGGVVELLDPTADLTAPWRTSTVAAGIGALACEVDDDCPRAVDVCAAVEVPVTATVAEPVEPVEPVDPCTEVEPVEIETVTEMQCANAPAGQLEPIACTTDEECPRVIDLCVDRFCPAVITNPSLALGDFDGNGQPDVVLGESTGLLQVYTRLGDGGWQRRDVRTGYTGINFMAAGDVDQDGRVDFVTSTYEFATRDRISWWRNTGE